MSRCRGGDSSTEFSIVVAKARAIARVTRIATAKASVITASITMAPTVVLIVAIHDISVEAFHGQRRNVGDFSLDNFPVEGLFYILSVDGNHYTSHNAIG